MLGCEVKQCGVADPVPLAIQQVLARNQRVPPGYRLTRCRDLGALRRTRATVRVDTTGSRHSPATATPITTPALKELRPIHRFTVNVSVQDR